MKKARFEIPGLIALFSILLLTSEIDNKNIRCIVLIVIIIGIVGLVYSITNGILNLLEMTSTTHSKELEKISEDLSEAIAKYNETQSSEMKSLILAIDNLNQATGLYTEKVNAMSEIQAQIVQDEQKLRAEIERIGNEVHEAYKAQEELFEEALNSLQKNQRNHENTIQKIVKDGIEKLNSDVVSSWNNVENTLEAFCSDFENEQKRANSEAMGNLSETKDAMNALKAQVKVSLDTMSKSLRDQTDAISEGLEDCKDEIGEQLSGFSKDQKARDVAQNQAMNDGIKEIGETISAQIQVVLDAHNHLLEYIEQVQEDWTTLNREEIAFLDKVWKE